MKTFIGIVAAVLLYALQVFAVMLILGAGHSYDGRIPDLGFLATLALVTAIRIGIIMVSEDK